MAGLWYPKKFEGNLEIARIMGATTNNIMKKLKTLTAAVLAVSTLSAPLAGLAADQKTEAKPKPYPLKTCVV